MNDTNLIQQVHYENGSFQIWFNGVSVGDQCKLQDGKVIWPEWIAKEIEEGQKEWERKNKPINKVLRFFGLYKSRTDNTFITIKER